MTQPQTLLLETHLKKLRLPSILRQYRKLATQATERNLTHEQFLQMLVEEEVLSQEENAYRNRLKAARFPAYKQLSQFDFSAVPGLNKALILKLAQGEYLTTGENEKAENIVILGNSGTGKTHIAIALGMEACAQGKKVGFYTAAGLVTLLVEASAQYQLSRVEARLKKLDLLIVDELGYLALDATGVKLLFSLLAGRYEATSTIITTNLPFDQWESIFNDRAMTAALVDRLTHYCHLVEMNGDSYRFKQSLKNKQAQ
jgi:DNA replication protein DnaC